MRAALLALALATVGCGPLEYSAGQRVATGAVDAVTAPAAVDKIDTAVGRVTTTAVTDARDVVLGAGTQVRLDQMIAALGVDLRAQLARSLDLRPVVRAAIDEALGPATKAELDALLADAVAHLEQASIHLATATAVPLEADVDALTSEIRDLAIALGVGVVLTAILVAFIVLEMRKHRAALERLVP